MKTIKLRSHVGADGTLHLNVPIGIKDTELEVTLTIYPARQGKDYPPEFFEQTYGSCKDDPIVIDDEGIYEERDEEIL